MPYELQKVKNGYYIVSTETGMRHSKKPLSKAKAEAQLRILLKKHKEEIEEGNDIIYPVSSKQAVVKVYDAVRQAKQEKELRRIAKGIDPENETEEYLKIQKKHNTINKMLNNPEFMKHLYNVDPLAHFKLTTMSDEEITGGGIFDFIKSASQKVKDLAQNVGKRVVGTIFGREDYPPQERNIISTYGNMPIKKICLYREPLQRLVQLGADLISKGQATQLKKKYGFDELYHLYMVISVEESRDKYIPIRLEKNEVINMEVNPNIKPDAEKLELLISPKFNYTLKQFLDNTRNAMGSKFFPYDPFNNNCQVFISSLISSNPPLEQDNPNAHRFVMQDVGGIETEMNPVTKSIFRGTTGLASRLNVLFKGYGFN